MTKDGAEHLSSFDPNMEETCSRSVPANESDVSWIRSTGLRMCLDAGRSGTGWDDPTSSHVRLRDMGDEIIPKREYTLRCGIPSSLQGSRFEGLTMQTKRTHLGRTHPEPP